MILVIGGAGYVGSHTCKALADSGEPFVVFDDLSKGHRAAVLGPFEQGNLADPDALRRVFSKYEIDAVMHFAAYSLVGESAKMPSEYWRNNVVAVLGLLDVMRERGVGKIVFSSSAATFGEPIRIPIDESHPQKPTSTYGETKLAVELMLRGYDEAYGLRHVALRYFNAAGSDPDGKLGEDHTPETHLIPAAILSGMGKTPGLNIFGTDYDTPDGTCVRDYIHVMDLARAHLLAIRHLRDGGTSRQYNLGIGRGFSVREVIETVEQVMDRSLHAQVGPRRPGDPAQLVASSELIRSELGWSPEVTDLRTMVEHAWRWRSQHPDGY